MVKLDRDQSIWLLRVLFPRNACRIMQDVGSVVAANTALRRICLPASVLIEASKSAMVSNVCPRTFSRNGKSLARTDSSFKLGLKAMVVCGAV